MDRETKRICKDRDVLKEYLSGRESEVVDIMVTLFSQEEVWDMRERRLKKEAAVRATIEEGRHYGASRERTAERIREKFSISQNDADDMLKRYW